MLPFVRPLVRPFARCRYLVLILALAASGRVACALPAAKARPLYQRLDKARMAAHLRYLAKTIGERSEGSAQERRAAHYVGGQLQRCGYRVRYEPFLLPDGSRSQNVIGEKWATAGRKYFVLGAHYDSRPGAPGANDNASGVAALLEIARVLADAPDVPVRIIAFGAEDRWEPHYLVNAHRLNGSRYHVAHLSAPERRRIEGMISLDMLGVGHVLQIGVLRGSTTNRSKALAEVLMEQSRALKVPHERFRTQPWSDHVWFDKAGIPAVWMWWYRDRDFDTPRDVVARVDNDKMLAAAQVALRGLLSWIKG